ncbi:MAG TPA: energy transducer TonB [Terriglobales bacterium]|nr:energy transducer TonB [Terriglobales bacterium]
MWRLGTIARLFVLAMLVVAPILAKAQQAEQADGTRKVVTRVTPRYPELAKAMSLKGVVKVEALVAANGTVKSVDPKGGHPVLVQAAQSAILQWKYEPGSRDTKEIIEITFTPHQ